MIRLTLLLAFCIWLVFVLGPEPAPPQAEAEEPQAPVTNASGTVTEITLETGETWQVDRVITTSAVPEDPQSVIAPPPDDTVANAAEEDAVEEPAVVPEDEPAETTADVLLLYVTGTRVNLRAGPSTDTAIVTALTQGTATELIAEAPDGWYEIRDPASGTSGFMSGDFLSPTAP